MGYSFDLGIFGGGQLARMSVHAAQRMGLECLTLDPDPESPAAQVGPALKAELGDVASLTTMFESCAALTLENEFVPADALEAALKKSGRNPACLTPGAGALRTIQDKLAQRAALAGAGLPSPRAAAMDGDATAAIATVGFPMVLKSRFGGYDGRGTRYAEDAQQLEDLGSIWSHGGWLAEQRVDFKRELAVMVCLAGEQSVCFPTVETVQAGHQCDYVRPCDRDGSAVAVAAARALGLTGLVAVELFERQDGELVVNELAPRPHNSGHYTLDWGGISQFEAHVRLSLGLPMPQPSGVATSMANLIGQERAGDWRPALRGALAAVPEARIHWYGKRQSRPGRKMGHVNVVGDGALNRALEARAQFYKAWQTAPVGGEED